MAENIGWSYIAMADLGSLAGRQKTISPDIYSNKKHPFDPHIGYLFCLRFHEQCSTFVCNILPRFQTGNRSRELPIFITVNIMNGIYLLSAVFRIFMISLHGNDKITVRARFNMVSFSQVIDSLEIRQLS